ncbi:MAG: plasmid mobilization relaxosome protein MobC [Candidatus Contendobacter sp.]|nr:plasmid mobilization relaxosome protein MobC [Candidatus Contendobacter sp.]
MAKKAESDLDEQNPKAHHGSQQRQRQKGVRAAVTPDEYAAIENRARAAGLSTAAYLRACALGDQGPRSQRRPPVEMEHFGKAVAELNKIGSNVNQIAHAANMGKDPDRILLARMAEELSIAVSELLRAAGRA